MADSRTLEIILKAVDKVSPEMDTVSGKLTKTLGKLGKGLVAGAGIASLGSIANNIMNNADQLQLMADKTGLTAERLQELQFIGADVGVELETIATAQAKLTRSMDAARAGTGDQADAFARLAIAVTDSNGNLRDAKTVMMEAVTALGKVGNETERDAMSLAIFGRGAQELNPLIRAGGQRLDELAAKARSSGAVMSNEAVAGVDKFGDSLEQLKMAIMGRLGQAFGAMVGWMERHRSTVDSVIGTVKSVLSSLGGVLGSVWGVFEAAWPAMSVAVDLAGGAIEVVIEGVTKVLEGLEWVINKVTAAWNFFTNAAYKAQAAAGDAAGKDRIKANWKDMGYSSEEAALKAFGYAEGGLITRPMVILAGERYRKELILPLEDRVRSLSLLTQYGRSLFEPQGLVPSLAGVGGYQAASSRGGSVIQATIPVSVTLEGREIARAVAKAELQNIRSGGG